MHRLSLVHQATLSAYDTEGSVIEHGVGLQADADAIIFKGVRSANYGERMSRIDKTHVREINDISRGYCCGITR